MKNYYKSNWAWVVKAGDERLTPVTKGEKVWTPIEGNDYLYLHQEEGVGVNIKSSIGDPTKLYGRLQDLCMKKTKQKQIFERCSVSVRVTRGLVTFG